MEEKVAISSSSAVLVVYVLPGFVESVRCALTHEGWSNAHYKKTGVGPNFGSLSSLLQICSKVVDRDRCDRGCRASARKDHALASGKFALRCLVVGRGFLHHYKKGGPVHQTLPGRTLYCWRPASRQRIRRDDGKPAIRIDLPWSITGARTGTGGSQVLNAWLSAVVTKISVGRIVDDVDLAGESIRDRDT